MAIVGNGSLVFDPQRSKGLNVRSTPKYIALLFIGLNYVTEGDMNIVIFDV